MSAVYEEIIQGESLQRSAPNRRHEEILERLHTFVAAALPDAAGLRLSSPRALLELTPGDWLHPDLMLIDQQSNEPYLVAEVIGSRDHTPDTVTKKALYEASHVPRVWMIDPRYDNVEIYHDTRYGLALKGILAGKETLSDKRLPALRLTIESLFAQAQLGSTPTPT